MAGCRISAGCPSKPRGISAACCGKIHAYSLNAKKICTKASIASSIKSDVDDISAPSPTRPYFGPQILCGTALFHRPLPLESENKLPCQSMIVELRTIALSLIRMPAKEFLIHSTWSSVMFIWPSCFGARSTRKEKYLRIQREVSFFFPDLWSSIYADAAAVPTLPMLNRSMSFSGYQDHHHDIVRNHHGEHYHQVGGGGGDQDDMSDDGSQVLVVGSEGGEKKKRLNMEQVKALDKNFEQANKLEPEKKIQLAKALGLQPRQVAIWFQNRRARWKTKQLEKDYNALKRQYDALKADNDSLLSHNNKLHAELMSLRNGEPAEYGAINLNNVDTKSFWSNNGSEISSEMNLNHSRTPQTGSPLSTNPSTQLQFSLNSFIPSSISQLLQTTSKPELDPQPQDDNTYCNLFNGAGGAGCSRSDGIENQPPPFWGWPEHQQNLN